MSRVKTVNYHLREECAGLTRMCRYKESSAWGRSQIRRARTTLTGREFDGCRGVRRCEAARRRWYIARNIISSRAKMICLALREGGTAEFDDRRAGRGQGLARWIEISAGNLPVLGRARRRQLLPGRLAGASFTDYRCSLPTPPPPPPPTTAPHPRPAPVNQTPASSLGPAASCDALSRSPPSPLRPPHLPSRAPPPRRGSTSTRHARPGIVGTSRAYTHPLQEREPTTQHPIDSPSTAVFSHSAACIDVLVCWPPRHRPALTRLRRGTITPGAATAIDAVCIAHSQWRTQTQNPSSRRSRLPVGMRKP